MEPFGFGLLILAGLGIGGLAARRERRAAAEERMCRDDLSVAEWRVAREYRQARRAMNDAAGQSWRNLAG